MQCNKLSLAALLGFISPALAGTHSVHPTPGMGDFTTVSAALASPLVADGDTVRVHPGSYSGTYVLSKKILLESTDGPAATTLDGAGSGPVIEMTVGAIVRGFTITGAGGPVSQGGVLITSTERATLEGNVVTENHPMGDIGIPCGGVTLAFGSSAFVVGNEIESNTSLSVGGFFAEATSSFDLVANSIRGNGSVGTIIGGALVGGSGRIVCTEITGNLGMASGGLYFAGGIGPALLDVISCTLYGNVAHLPTGSVGGLLLDDGGELTIVNTTIAMNTGATGMDVYATPDYFAPGGAGTLDLSYSHIFFPGALPPGSFMVPPGTPPALVAPAAATAMAPTTSGDFHPLPVSPYVDAGLGAAFPIDVSPADLEGASRFLGAETDIGAYETGVGCAAPIYYGAAKTTSLGTHPFLTAEGSPSVTGSGFHVVVHDGVPGKAGIMLWSADPAWMPFFGGFLHLAPPVKRIGLSILDGSGSADYEIALDPSMIGTTRHYQHWFRDKANPDLTAVGLSAALRVTFCD